MSRAKELGAYFRAVRRGAQVTQWEVAKAMTADGFEMSEKTVGRTERGQRDITVDEWAALAAWCAKHEVQKQVGGSLPVSELMMPETRAEVGPILILVKGTNSLSVEDLISALEDAIRRQGQALQLAAELSADRPTRDGEHPTGYGWAPRALLPTKKVPRCGAVEWEGDQAGLDPAPTGEDCEWYQEEDTGTLKAESMMEGAEFGAVLMAMEGRARRIRDSEVQQPWGRARSLVVTKLEEARLWLGEAERIRRS
jgi:hypothetical protein